MATATSLLADHGGTWETGPFENECKARGCYDDLFEAYSSGVIRTQVEELPAGSFDPETHDGQRTVYVLTTPAKPAKEKNPRPEWCRPAIAGHKTSITYYREWGYALGRSNLSPTAKFVGMLFKEHAHRGKPDHPDFGTCYRGAEGMAKELGKHRNTVSKYITELVRAGFLVDTGERKGRAIKFFIAIPES